jgi:hypothetical protein
LSAVTILTIVLVIAAIAACISMIWLAREGVATMRSVRTLSDDTHERLMPLLDKADVMVDAANAELWRLDGAITRFEDASVRVSVASGTLSEIVQAPAEIVTGVAERVRKAIKDRKRQQPTGTPAPAETPAADDVSGATDDTVGGHADAEDADRVAADMTGDDE